MKQDLKQLMASLKKCMPTSTPVFRRKVIARAFIISKRRLDSREYNHQHVMSVIRGSLARIKAGVNSGSVLHLFRAETSHRISYPIRAPPDPREYLTPNENWSGKGSAGKHHLSENQ
jgi:hypothetical protein